MPSLNYRRRMTRRIAGGVALVGLAGFLFLQWEEFGVSRAHAERYRAYERATLLRAGPLRSSERR